MASSQSFLYKFCTECLNKSVLNWSCFVPGLFEPNCTKLVADFSENLIFYEKLFWLLKPGKLCTCRQLHKTI